MAFFSITIERIGSIEPISGADRIVKATLKDVAFSFVVGKDLFKVDEQVLYFPIDSVIPEYVQEKLGVVGKLAGKNKDRVKTVKLKQVLSQGLVGKLTLIDDMNYHHLLGLGQFPTSEEITAFLGVTKYEPPIIPDKAGNLKPLPNGLSVYDIEGCERFYIPLGKLMNQKVWVLEKLEGSNGSVTYNPDTDAVHVNQRRHTIEEIEGHKHTWWDIARKQKFIDFVIWAADAIKLPVTVYFEVIGPGWQGNIYKLNECVGYVFDIRVGDFFIDKGRMFKLLDSFFGRGNYKHAPVLSQGITLAEWLNGKSIVEASNGESKLYKCLREGIVVSPEVEQHDESLMGRLILKQRDSIYLSKSDN